MTGNTKRPFRFWSFFFSTKGRVSRVPYALFVPLTYGVLLNATYFTSSALYHYEDYTIRRLLNMSIGLSMFILLWPYFSVICKRLHDTGLPLWPAFLLFAPIAGAFVFVFWELRHISNPLATPTRLDVSIDRYARSTIDGFKFFNLAAMCILALIPGTKGANRYGPDPRNPDQAASDVF